MRLRLLKIVRRGRSAVPETRPRMRVLVFLRRSLRSLAISAPPLLAGLAGLAPDHFAGVHDTLALVGLGLAELADVGGHLAHELTVDAGHHDVGVLLPRDLDALGGIVEDGMAVAEVQTELAALEGSLVADAHDVEFLLPAFRHAGHGV